MIYLLQKDEVFEENLFSLYESLGLDEDSFIPENELLLDNASAPYSAQFSASGGIYKKNSLHLFGVDDLNTVEVFEFFNGKNIYFWLKLSNEGFICLPC